MCTIMQLIHIRSLALAPSKQLTLRHLSSHQLGGSGASSSGCSERLTRLSGWPNSNLTALASPPPPPTIGLKIQLVSASNLSSDSRKGATAMNDTTAKYESSQVRLDLDGRRFVLALDGGQEAWIEFKSTGENKIDMYHSEVPRELRGRGLGARLARGALEQAARKGLKVKLSCSYLISYLDRCDDPNAGCVVGR